MWQGCSSHLKYLLMSCFDPEHRQLQGLQPLLSRQTRRLQQQKLRFCTGCESRRCTYRMPIRFSQPAQVQTASSAGFGCNTCEMKRGCINGCHIKGSSQNQWLWLQTPELRRCVGEIRHCNLQIQHDKWMRDLWLCMERHRLEYFTCHSGFRSCNGDVMQEGYGGKTDPQISGLANCRACNASLQLSWLVNISPTSEGRPWVGHRKAKLHATNDVCWLSPCWLPSNIEQLYWKCSSSK